MAEHIKTHKGDIVMVLSADEARGLFALVEEGREGILTDAAAAKAYIGPKAKVDAAVRAADELKRAIHNLT